MGVGVSVDTGPTREGGHVLEMQRRRLLLGFGEVLAQEGLERASVGGVCRRAGVSRRTFYDVFDDLEGCFRGLLEERLERISGEVRSAYSQGARWQERIRSALAQILAFFDSEPAFARACLMETPKGGPTILALRRGVIDFLAGAIDEGRAQAKSGVNPPSLTAQGLVGGAIALAGARLLEDDAPPLLELLNPLMSMIVLPYLGASAAKREAQHPIPPLVQPLTTTPVALPDPFKDLPLRITLRTARVLHCIAEDPGANNRQIGDTAGVPDQGQISKLLRRLACHGLISNNSQGHTKGEPNAWTLTPRGRAIQHAIDTL